MTRIDVLLFERGLAKSREKARALLMEGVVLVNGEKVDKAGTNVPEDALIEIKEDPVPFVSRGGLKLDKAIKVFPIDLNGCMAADIGASTGGFTDCMLQNGARHVYSVDVGYGQLDWKLRNDERVTVMERSNARYMEPDWYAEPLDFASIDVSFISLDKILPPLHACLKDGGHVVALIKPQFEAGRKDVGKNGVVRDPAVHEKVIRRILELAMEKGYHVRGLEYSPITGPKGNIEFLLYLEKHPEGEESKTDVPDGIIPKLVEIAHNSL